MEQNQPFIGAGNNPNGPDLPLGFGTELVSHPAALAVYASMDTQDKEQVVKYIQSATTGQDALHRIGQAIHRLEQGERNFQQ